MYHAASSSNASLDHLNDAPSKFSCLVTDGNHSVESDTDSNNLSTHYDLSISGDFNTETIIDYVFEGNRPASGSTHIQVPLSSIKQAQSSNVMDLSKVSDAFLIHGKEQEKSRRISRRDLWA